MNTRKRIAELELPPFAHVSEEDASNPVKVRRYMHHAYDMTLPGDIELDVHPFYGEPNTPCGWNITIYEQPNMPEDAK